MSHLADRFIVLLDANVLYPFRKRDVLLRFYEAGLFRARWTDEIISEWTQSLLKRRPDLKRSIAAQQEKLSAVFPEALVAGYEHLKSGLKLPDNGDLHVLAAAFNAARSTSSRTMFATSLRLLSRCILLKPLKRTNSSPERLIYTPRRP